MHNESKMHNILISGGFGYIGCNLIDFFLKRNYKIGVITRSIPSYANVFLDKIKVYNQDIIEPLKIDDSQKYGVFIHLAAANDRESMNPEKAIQINVQGTRNCLELSKNLGISRFIYFSTFQVYGVDSGIINENIQIQSKNDYAITHFFAEEYVKMYNRQYGINYIIVRPTNIYGRPFNLNLDRWSLVPNCFCKDAFGNSKITLRSSGKQVKDFISLDFLSQMTLNLCEPNSAYTNKIINASSGKCISILKMAEMVRSVYEKLYLKPCNIEVLSEFPQNEQELKVNSLFLYDEQEDIVRDNDIISQIEKIFKLLEGGTENG